MAANIPIFTLNNGLKIPSVGMGCWTNYSSHKSVYNMCKTALKVGYRHFDTAEMYGNEAAVGQAVRDSGIPRQEIFVTTKLNNDGHHRVRKAFEESLAELNIGYVDLYLMHWPQASRGGLFSAEQNATFVETWKEMEKLLDTGKCKAIGVSNFSIKTLSELLPHVKVVPAVNQVEMHPCLPQEELLQFCKQKGIVMQAYSPLGQGDHRFMPYLEPIAQKYTKSLGKQVSTAQIALSWLVQRGVVVLPKSENEGRMKANIDLIELHDEDMAAVSAIHKKPGMHRSLCGYHSSDGSVFGWSYEKLGWNFKKGGVIS
ncbi:aado/keto reductase [Gloeophyllum trabeum ATCC 11539]|uniref:Aado/keto reductase n=1 Tax=Gloeophyllum trabeum (strain ATCC 11539 / FP-39264 / Madison 617) TaxID=670483 RepID=S7Q8C4_GLOTA|nr:aldo/keto reductase [Gloeophyllum trabeum ATCC 11539]EPQ55782.1 aado/keto reductase [Gloeophyllum trabeum ATCC 11539]